jgi:hypothetical protein
MDDDAHDQQIQSAGALAKHITHEGHILHMEG